MDNGIANLILKSELQQKAGDYSAELKDNPAKIFMLQQLTEMKLNYARYKSETEKARIEEMRNLTTLIISIVAAGLTVFFGVRGLISTSDPIFVLILFIYLVFIIYVIYAYFSVSYKRVLLTEYDVEFSDAYIDNLVRHYNDKWVAFSDKRVVPKSQLEDYTVNKQRRIERTVRKIQKAKLPFMQGDKNTIKAVDFNLEGLLSQEKKFRTVLFLDNHGWRLADKDIYRLYYYAYDHTGAIHASETVKTAKKYPELQKKGFYRVTRSLARQNGGFGLLLLKKEPVRVDDKIMQSIAKGL